MDQCYVLAVVKDGPDVSNRARELMAKYSHTDKRYRTLSLSLGARALQEYYTGIVEFVDMARTWPVVLSAGSKVSDVFATPEIYARLVYGYRYDVPLNKWTVSVNPQGKFVTFRQPNQQTALLRRKPNGAATTMVQIGDLDDAALENDAKERLELLIRLCKHRDPSRVPHSMLHLLYEAGIITATGSFLRLTDDELEERLMPYTLLHTVAIVTEDEGWKAGVEKVTEAWHFKPWCEQFRQMLEKRAKTDWLVLYEVAISGSLKEVIDAIYAHD